MELTTPTDSSAPGSSSKSPDGDANEHGHGSSNDQHHASNSMPAPAIAAAAVHQPKIVQTAFIHKLYKYVHLLCWLWISMRTIC